jgi:DNA-directed RNA polymerase specialized sigma24 family protein
MDFSDEQLVRAWGELPEELRATLFLVDIKQLSPRKVARMMDVPVDIVRNQATCARAMLKRKLLSYCQPVASSEGKNV